MTSFWTGCLIKTADESKTTNAISDDNTLVLTLNASKYYRFRIQCLVWANATADFRFRIRAAAATAGGYTVFASDSMYANGTNLIGTTSGYYGGFIADLNADVLTFNITGNNTTTNRGYISASGIIQSASSSPGTLAFRWAQGTTNATGAKVFAGSYLLYEEFT